MGVTFPDEPWPAISDGSVFFLIQKIYLIIFLRGLHSMAACKNCHVFMPTSKNVSREKYRLPHSHATVFTRCFYHSNYGKNDSFFIFLSLKIHQLLSDAFQGAISKLYCLFFLHITYFIKFYFLFRLYSQLNFTPKDVKSKVATLGFLIFRGEQSYVLFIYIQKS